MKKAGQVLIVVQFIALFGSLAQDYAQGVPLGTTILSMNVIGIIAYFLPLIIGIALINKAKKEDNGSGT